MSILETKILEIFKKEPNKEFSTGEIVEKIFRKELVNLEEKILKERKARLHRKILYHLNKLVKENILIISNIKGKGEKIFSLAEEGEVEISIGKRKIVIHKESKIITPADNYKELIIFGKEELNKINSLIIDATKFNTLNQLLQEIIKIISFINDSLAIIDFDYISARISEYEDFFNSLKQLSEDYNKKITININLKKENSLRIARLIAKFQLKNIELIIRTNKDSIRKEKEELNNIIKLFIKNNVKLNISQDNKSPLIYGKAGIYTITKEDWSFFLKNREKLKGYINTGSTIVIDYSIKSMPIHKLILQAAKSLLIIHKKRLFNKELYTLRKDYSFRTQNELIRVWNYKLEEELCFEELKSGKEVIEEFEKEVRRIYRAAAMPLNFKIKLSSAFKKSGVKTERQYIKKRIYGLKNLQEENFLKNISKREKYNQLFICDRIRFFRSEKNKEQIINEILFLINTFSFSLITYDFSQLKGEIKLTEFF